MARQSPLKDTRNIGIMAHFDAGKRPPRGGVFSPGPLQIGEFPTGTATWTVCPGQEPRYHIPRRNHALEKHRINIIDPPATGLQAEWIVPPVSMARSPFSLRRRRRAAVGDRLRQADRYRSAIAFHKTLTSSAPTSTALFRCAQPSRRHPDGISSPGAVRTVQGTST